MKSARSRVSPDRARRFSISSNTRGIMDTAKTNVSPAVRKSLDSNFIKSQLSNERSSNMGSLKKSTIYESIMTDNGMPTPSQDYLKSLKVDSNLAFLKQESAKIKQFKIYEKQQLERITENFNKRFEGKEVKETSSVQEENDSVN